MADFGKISDKVLQIGCLMRIKVGIAKFQSTKLYSRAFTTHYFLFYFIKGTLCNSGKKIQHMDTSAIPDCLFNLRWGKHVCLAYSLSYYSITV